MSLSIGIVGLPNVGKSTLFNALTEKSVPAENYPFCTIDPSVGIVAVPDNRLQKLTELSQSKKTVPAAIEFVDIAGLVAGASKGEGLGNKFLSHIREVDAILEIVRTFKDPDITHVSGKVDPLSDIETINLELMLADMQAVSKRLESIEREIKKGDKNAVAEKEVLEKALKHLEDGKLLSQTDLTDDDKLILKQLNLLSLKPILYGLNTKVNAKQVDTTELMKMFNDTGSHFVEIDAGLGSELAGLNREEKQEFLKEYGRETDGLDELIKESYKLLDLITYFTTGEDETRAWTIKANSTAPIAGTAIHTDFKDKFIRAEVVAYEDLISAGSYAKARENGKVRTEGKEYIVQDGDVLEFKI